MRITLSSRSWCFTFSRGSYLRLCLNIAIKSGELLGCTRSMFQGVALIQSSFASQSAV
jgi:hypothetical protein